MATSALSERPLWYGAPWNQPIPANPTVAATSAAVIAKINGWGDPPDLVWGSAGQADDYWLPVYRAASTDDLYTVTISVSNRPQLETQFIRIPSHAEPAGGIANLAAPGLDSHLVVIQPNGLVAELWDVSALNHSTNTITAAAGSLCHLWGAGLPVKNGALGTNNSCLHGLVTAQELESGHIPHAIQLIAKSTTGSYVFPGGKAAGSTDPIDAPDSGALIQLNYTTAEIDALSVPAWKKVLLKAWATYGGYVVDTGGNSLGVRMESGMEYVTRGGTDPWRDLAVQYGYTEDPTDDVFYVDLATGVDWSRLRVIDPAYVEGLFSFSAIRMLPNETVSNNWSTLTGGATVHECLDRTGYPHDATYPDNSQQVVTSTTGHTLTIGFQDYTPAADSAVVSAVAYVNLFTSGTDTIALSVTSGGTTLATATAQNSGAQDWWVLPLEPAPTVSQLASVRLQATKSGGAASNIRAAFIEVGARQAPGGGRRRPVVSRRRR